MTRERGFSLIELMLALAIAGIVGTVVLGGVVSEQVMFERQKDLTEAQGEARVALKAVVTQLRTAGYGVIKDPSPVNGISPVPVGQCQGANADECNGVDAGSDRLRITASDSQDFTYATWQPGSSMFRIGPKPGPQPKELATGASVLVTGKCSHGGKITSDVIVIDDPGKGQDNQWWYTYKFKNKSSCTCQNCDYDQPFTFASSQVVDFRIDRSSAAHPALLLERSGSAAVAVAYDIDDLQVAYGLDTSPTPDNTVDTWCNGQRADSTTTKIPLDPSFCLGSAPAIAENQARVIAVRVSVVARSRQTFPEVFPAITVEDHVIPADHYRRWVYRSTVVLRNLLR